MTDDRADRIRRGDDGTFVVDRSLVSNCFGCGQANEQGLRLRFREVDDGWVETRVRVPRHLCGMDTVVHGGIQATILDEVCGVAAQLGLPPGSTDDPCVTAELSLRYQRPVPIADDVVAQARVTGVEGRRISVEGRIVSPDGEVLTAVTSRWAQLVRPPA
ncbi:MAG: PaaI family thioesterase [Actinobacteria bacterium]|nr:PaaI family thioesterase [Actinomycetota bacterium]